MFKIGSVLRHIEYTELNYEIRDRNIDDDGNIVWTLWSYYSSQYLRIGDSSLRDHVTGYTFLSQLILDKDEVIIPSTTPLRRHRLCTE